MKRFLFLLVAFGCLVLVAGLWITRPKSVDASLYANLAGSIEAGEIVFAASGCAACHAEQGNEEVTSLAGGRRFETEFGTFIAPEAALMALVEPIFGPVTAWSGKNCQGAVRVNRLSLKMLAVAIANALSECFRPISIRGAS